MSSPYESGPTPRHDNAPLATSPPPPGPTPCRKCRQPISAGDAFCRFCGARQHVSDPFYYHPVWILILAFTVLGPFALGLVWRAQAMSPATKAVLAAIILVYSAVTFYFVWVLCATLYEHFSLLNQIM